MREAELDDAYSRKRVKRSLLHFLMGKGASAVVALGMLLLLVRVLDREEYGVYIVLLALLEMVQIGSSLGCYSALHRYLPELLSRRQGLALRSMFALITYWRASTLLLACIVCALFAGPLARMLGLPQFETVVALYAIVIFFEGGARYLDVVFETLLMQGMSQMAILLRNGLRVACVAFFWLRHEPLTLLELVWIEAIASGCGLAFGGYLVHQQVNIIARTWPGTEAMPDTRRVRTYALPAYLAQLLGLMQGPDLVKMLVARLAGAIQSGAFGFAATVASMLQRYLPVFLLIGLVRPLFVAHHARGKDVAKLIGMANLVFKLNVFVIAPAALLFFVGGERLASLLSGGKFPQSWLFMAGFCLLLVVQTLHTVLGLLALAAEEARASLVGVAYGLAGIAIGVAGFPYLGASALCGGLIVSELIWCMVMVRALRHHGMHFRLDWRGMSKLWFAAACAALPLYVFDSGTHISVGIELLRGAAMAVLYLLVARVVRPFSADERQLINSALPKPLFIW